MWKLCASAILVCAVAACGGSKPPTGQELVTQEQKATMALNDMKARDPGLDALIRQSGGYIVFPSVGNAGALLVGGAYGKGILFENGQPTGFVEVKQGSVGPQLGGQTYAELIVIRDPYAVQKIKTGSFDLGAGATAVALKTGAAASAQFSNGVTVFVMPHGGLMAGVSIHGQSLSYKPLAG
jgi:lipid-binding SYLF domain-containing protein